MKNTLLVIFACLTTNAYAQDATEVGQRSSYAGISTVVFQETEEPGAIGEVIFNNRLNNSEGDFVRSLSLGDISIDIEFSFNVEGTGDDAITVYPPQGYYALPETIRVVEGFSQTLYIYPELPPMS